MDLKREILGDVIHRGQWETIRGMIAALPFENLKPEYLRINPEDFTDVAMWTDGDDLYEVAYSHIAMVLYKNGKLHGVAEYDPDILANRALLISKFSLGPGAVSLMEGML